MPGWLMYRHLLASRPIDRRCEGGLIVGRSGAIAQMGERLLCKQKVAGSIPAGSTSIPTVSSALPIRMSGECR